MLFLKLEEIINDIAIYHRKLLYIERFDYGENKIEFMLKYKKYVISISVLLDFTYDFMVFDELGDKIILSNTTKLKDLNAFKQTVKKDLSTLC